MPKLRTIVFVEDDKDLRRILVKWLEGYSIHAFDNADPAYEFAIETALGGDPVDLFILDIMLAPSSRDACRNRWRHHDAPIDNGLHLGRKFREFAEYKNTPIIFLSAKFRSDKDKEMVSKNIKAICYSKPIPYKDLQQTIVDILGHPEQSYWQRFAQVVGIK